MSNRFPSFNESHETVDGLSLRPLLAAGIFGFGFSGLIDVLVIHLILQWHHLLSGIYPMDTVDGLRTNIFADGLFSVGMILIAGIGAGLVWQSERRAETPLPVRPIAGAAVIGLGVFDLYDAIVDHALLGLHQPLSQGGQYNPHWTVVSILIILAGLYIYRTSVENTSEESDRSA